MTDRIYTTTQLLADEALRRQVAGEVLNPNARNHKWHPCGPAPSRCLKCGARHKLGMSLEENTCVPDPAPGSNADIAEQLVRMCDEGKLFYVIDRMASLGQQWAGHWKWFVFATPAERIVCCLLALLPEKVRLDP